MNYANIDNKLSHAQASIGLSSNIAQIAQTYMYNFDDKKYRDYVCILSVLAQVSIDSAKRAFDVDLNAEIDRIQKDMDIKNNGYPMFWKHIKDKKCKIGDKKFDPKKINKNLKCPMNYLMELKFQKFRGKESTLPMSHFFQKFELETNRRQSKKVEGLIQDYGLMLKDNNYSLYGREQDLLLREDFDELIESIKTTYLSNTYLGLISWLIDRAFLITDNVARNTNNMDSNTRKNKSLLLKILYDVNPKSVLKVFSNGN